MLWGFLLTVSTPPDSLQVIFSYLMPVPGLSSSLQRAGLVLRHRVPMVSARSKVGHTHVPSLPAWSHTLAVGSTNSDHRPNPKSQSQAVSPPCGQTSHPPLLLVLGNWTRRRAPSPPEEKPPTPQPRMCPAHKDLSSKTAAPDPYPSDPPSFIQI